MGLGTRDVIGRSLYRTFRPNGLLLVLGVVIANLVFQVGLSSLLLDAIRGVWDDLVATYPELFEAGEDPASTLPLALEIPSSVALALLVLGFVFSILVLGVAVRVFSTENTETIPRELVVEDLAWMGVNLIVGTVVFFLLWSVGLALFVVPGIVLFVLLIYYLPAVAVEGRSFIDAMSRSWRVTRGNRLGVFVLFLAFFVLWFLTTLVVLILNGFAILIHPLVAELVTQVANGILTVVFAAIVAISFDELVPKGTDRDEDEEDPFEEFIPADRNVQW